MFNGDDPSQVSWDEPDLLQNVKRINPWLVEIVSNLKPMHLSSFVPTLPPRKKLRMNNHPDFSFDGQYPTRMFSVGSPVNNNNLHLPFRSFAKNTTADSTPSSIQGARHAQIGISLSDFHQLDKLHPRIATNDLIVGNHHQDNDISCLLTIGNSSPETTKSTSSLSSPTSPSSFLLFGKTILTEKQMRTVSSGVDVGDNLLAKLNLETGHCKVFMESEDVGRTLDLSALTSFDEMCSKLADMFDIKKSDMKADHVHYRDSSGSVKLAGDVPFGWVGLNLNNN